MGDDEEHKRNQTGYSPFPHPDQSTGFRRPVHRTPKAGRLVSSEDNIDTSDTVVENIRNAVKAKETGIQITRVRKAKKEEIEDIANGVKDADRKLKIEEKAIKRPLVIMKNVMNYLTNEEVKAALERQNRNLLGE